MTEFVRYQHVERLGNMETDGILDGFCHIFYKIDGTNGSIWFDGEGICCGSRNRTLRLDNDNAGFMAWVLSQDKFQHFFEAYPNLRLFGEWLVPHSLKTYRETAWRDFYVFDVMDENHKHVAYEDYQRLLDAFEINYIPLLALIKNPTEESILKCMEKSGQFLIEDGQGAGEGIVIKNYNFVNRFGRTNWAKMISNEFKEKHHKAMGAPEVNNTLLVEEKIVDEFLTDSMIEKEKAKIVLDNGGWNNKCIPRLLGTVYYEFVREETWNFVKRHKQPKISFSVLSMLCNRKVKNYLGL